MTRTRSTPSTGASLRDHRLDEVLGRARAGGDADDARVAERGEVELLGAVDAQHDRAARRRARPSSSAIVFDEFALPITTTASASAAMRGERALAVGRREAEVVAGRGPQLAGTARACSVERCPVQSLCASVVWASSATLLGVGDLGEHRVEVVLVLDEVDRLGRDGERADRLVVAGVADVEDREALAAPAPWPRGAPW